MVASTAASLITPLAAQASDLVNLEEMNSYSSSNSKVQRFDNQTFINKVSEDSANLKDSLDGLEVQQNEFEAGGFSETTTAAFTSNFYIGSTDDDDGTADDVVMATYDFQIDLNTSFTGEESFDVSIDAGNSAVEGVAEFDGNGSGDGLIVDGIAYTFPLTDKTTVKVGDGTDASDLVTTAIA